MLGVGTAPKSWCQPGPSRIPQNQIAADPSLAGLAAQVHTSAFPLVLPRWNAEAGGGTGHSWLSRLAKPKSIPFLLHHRFLFLQFRLSRWWLDLVC